MVFSSLLFVFLFLTLNLVCYYSVKTIRQKNIVLLVFSLIFYAWGGAAYLLLLAGMASSGVGTHRICLLFCKEIPVVPRRISQVYIHLLCLLFSVSHVSKRHFLKWKSAATAALSAKKRNGRALSMAAQPFILTIDGVRPFCYSD